MTDQIEALKRIHKWNEANNPFIPDWNNLHQVKYSLKYYTSTDMISVEATMSIVYNTFLPHFKSLEDIDKFIDENKEDIIKVMKP